MKGRKIDNTRPRKNRCRGTKKDGTPCRAAATPGGLCYFHGNPVKAVECGREGGRKNRRLAVETEDPLPDLNTALGVREANKRLSEDLYAGKIDPRIADSLVRSLSLQLRAIETTDLARRVAEIEKQLRQGPADPSTTQTEAVSDSTRGNSDDDTVH